MRLIPAFILPLAAFALQWLFWNDIRPYALILFYPAVFFSSRIGGLFPGIISMVLSTLIVWWFFIPPRYSFFIDQQESFLALGVFAFMGLLFSMTHERLRKAGRQAEASLAADAVAKENLKKQVNEKTADLAGISDLLHEMGRVAKIGGWEFDPATGKGTWTEEVARIHDLDPADETSMEKGMSFYHGQSRLEIEKAIREAVGNGKPYSLELEMITAKGNHKWAQTIGRPIIENGKTVRVRGSFQDITERKRAEQELRKSEERARKLALQLKSLQESIAQLASARSLDEIMAISKTAARGLSGADGATFVLREDDHCFYADEDAIAPLWKGQKFPISACISGWVMLNHQPVVIEDIYADPRIPMDVYRPTFVKSLAMVPIRAVEPLGAIGNYWAETHRPTDNEMDLLGSLADAVAVAMENVRSYEMLEQRVARRTAQLESANKELEAFSYSVSHDLRAPLRAIDGYTRILVEDYAPIFDAEGKRICAVISESARNMGRLIDDLLAFSRVGRASIQLSPVDMQGLANAIFYEVTTPQDRERIEFSLYNLQPAIGDPTLLRQVWMNLLANAVKFSAKKDRAVIGVTGEISDDEIIYCVRDNGVGFDMKYVEKLFGVFQRLHSMKEFEGTGVGLAIVQRIIHRHGGRVRAVGEVDKGAAFYFTLKADKKEGDRS